MTIARLSCLAALVVSLVLTVPRAGAEEPTAGSTDVRHLELGDIYVVVVRCDGAKATYNGQLVQMTDQWLVLREWSECWSERRVPKVSRVPFATRHFLDVDVDWIVTDRWIPRAAATVAGRCISEDKSDFEPLTATQPRWNEAPRIEFAEKGESADCTGPIEVEGTVLRCETLIFDEKRVPTPVLGYLPKWGVLFTMPEVELREGIREVPLSSLLSVEERAPISRMGHKTSKNSSSMGR
jgi:hypothetical protein